MSFDSLLVHTLFVVGQEPVLDISLDPTYDDYGQPIREAGTPVEFRGDAQIKSAREVARLSQTGPVVGQWTLYARPRELSTADAITHDPALCPCNPDLPVSSWQIAAIRPIRDRTGVHHFEIDADLVASPELVTGS